MASGLDRRRFLLGAAGGTLAALGVYRLQQLDKRVLRIAELSAGKPSLEALSTGSPAKDTDTILWQITRAYQRMLAAAEGTLNNQHHIYPYQVIVGYGQFNSYSDHPRQLVRFGPSPRQVSDAAGAYQFISPTFDRVRQAHDLWPGDAFSPANQDLLQLYLHAETRGHHNLLDGATTLGGLTFVQHERWAKAIYRDSREWASLPGHNIGAATNQRTKPLHWLWSKFCWELNREQGLLRPTAWVLPEVAQVVTSQFGYRKRGNRWQFHAGVDLACDHSPVVSPEAGRIVSLPDLSGGGKTLVHEPASDPFKRIRFMHLSERLVKVGEWVEKGQRVAISGNTGASTTGPHLHVEVWQGVADGTGGAPTDPLAYLRLGEYL